MQTFAQIIQARLTHGLAAHGGGKAFRKCAALPLVLAVLTGCGRQDVQVYSVPKESPKTTLPAGHPPATSAPRLHWASLPAGWQEKAASGMRAASFVMAGPEGKQAELAAIPLPGVTGIELDTVNMWRSELGLEPVKQEQLATASAAVEAGGTQGRLYDLTGTSQKIENHPAFRTVAAIVERDGVTWFFKLSGDEAVVAQQKEPFQTFLKGVHFAPATAAPAPGMSELAAMPPGGNLASAAPAAGKPAWKAPAGWKEKAGSAMRLASFEASGKEGAADISVIMLPGEAGGLLANVNRWRGQIGLGALSDAELTQAGKVLDANGTPATLVEMTSGDQKTGVVGAIMMRPGQSWFFKMTGPAGVVAEQREAFVEFVKSVHFTP